MVKVAIIGAGFIGEIHAECYKKIKNSELVAIVDKVEKKRNKLANKLNIRGYENIDRLFENEEIECIDICVPSYLHLKILKKAAQAGKHIFCEKPLALTLDDADEMVNLVNENNVRAFVGHVSRFSPEYIKTREIIKKGIIGKPLYGSFKRLAPTPFWFEKDWGFNEKYSGGVTVDLQIHDLDMLIWYFGKPNIIKSQGLYDAKMGGFKHISTAIEFNNGSCGLAETGWAFVKGFPSTREFRILCEKGAIEWMFRRTMKKNDLIVYENDGSVNSLNLKQIDPFLSECQYFINCIENNREIKQSTFEDGRAALELALAAVKSAKSKEVIVL